MIIDEIYPKIVYYKNIFDEDIDFVDLVEKDDLDDDSSIIKKWKPWNSSDNLTVFGSQKFVSAYEFLNETLLSHKIVKMLDFAIRSCSKEYSLRYGVDLGRLAPLSISKYFKGNSMGSHTDSYNGDTSAMLSIVLYLNDNYEGGELFFKKQNIKIKPEKNSLVAFPSVEPYFHESLPIISGTKYLSPGFWNKV
jgi:hypothetical protein